MRKSWDEYYLDIAKSISTRSTCDRLNVGAVIVKDNRILTTGYNGSLPGQSHCDDIGHLIFDNSCIRTIHAEINAISQAAKYGILIEGSKIYITHAPCLNCFKTIINVGIKEIIFTDLYKINETTEDLYNQIKPYSSCFKNNFYKWKIS